MNEGSCDGKERKNDKLGAVWWYENGDEKKKKKKRRRKKGEGEEDGMKEK